MQLRFIYLSKPKMRKLCLTARQTYRVSPRSKETRDPRVCAPCVSRVSDKRIISSDSLRLRLPISKRRTIISEVRLGRTSLTVAKPSALRGEHENWCVHHRLVGVGETWSSAPRASAFARVSRVHRVHRFREWRVKT